MSAQIRDVISNYDQVMDEARNSRRFAVDMSKNRAYWLTSYAKQLHPEKLTLRVSRIIPVTETLKTFRLVSVDGYLPPFIAGQYLTVFTDIDGVRTGRPYSISSPPTERAYYEITIRKAPGGFVSNYFHDCVKVGDIIETASPAGQFYYNPMVHGKKIVLIAGGIGITPFRSMIRNMLDRGNQDVDIHMLYGSRTINDVPFLDELREYEKNNDNFKFDLVISEPDENWTGLKGFISADMIREAGIDIDGSVFFVCGPKGLYDFCVPQLESLGLTRKRLRREVMGAPACVSDDPAWPADVAADAVFTIKYGDKEFPARADESVLTAFERAGLHTNFGCRAGECSLCRLKVTSGKVFQLSTALVRKADRKHGYIHSCASYPISDMVIAVE